MRSAASAKHAHDRLFNELMGISFLAFPSPISISELMNVSQDSQRRFNTDNNLTVLKQSERFVFSKIAIEPNREDTQFISTLGREMLPSLEYIQQ